jgi:hypothetical protein
VAQAIAIHVVTNEVHVYNGQHVEQPPASKIICAGVSTARMSPTASLPYQGQSSSLSGKEGRKEGEDD